MRIKKLITLFLKWVSELFSKKIVKKSVFVSYSHEHDLMIKDQVLVFSSSGHDVFFDDDIGAGANWKQRLEYEIKRSDEVMLFWCCHCENSKYVEWEYKLATKYGKKFVPFVFSSCKKTFPSEIADKVQFKELAQGHECASCKSSVAPFTLTKEEESKAFMQAIVTAREKVNENKYAFYKGGVKPSRPSRKFLILFIILFSVVGIFYFIFWSNNSSGDKVIPIPAIVENDTIVDKVIIDTTGTNNADTAIKKIDTTKSLDDNTGILDPVQSPIVVNQDSQSCSKIKTLLHLSNEINNKEYQPRKIEGDTTGNIYADKLDSINTSVLAFLQAERSFLLNQVNLSESEIVKFENYYDKRHKGYKKWNSEMRDKGIFHLTYPGSTFPKPIAKKITDYCE